MKVDKEGMVVICPSEVQELLNVRFVQEITRQGIVINFEIIQPE